MKLEQKVFVFEYDGNLEKETIGVFLNDSDLQVTPKHLFKNIDVSTDKIMGYSLLQFYIVKDGSLVDKEGNIVSFKVKDKHLKINVIRDPFILIDSDLEVSLSYVVDVATILGLNNPEKTFYKLTEGEKKILKDNREKELSDRELKKREEEEKKKLEQETPDQQAARLKEETEAKAKVDAEQAKIKEAEEAKLAKEENKTKTETEKATEEHEQKVEDKKIPAGENILTQREYKLVYRKYQKMGFNEYKKDHYKFFYGSDIPDAEVPFILADMDGYFIKLDGSLLEDLANGAEFEFSNERGEDKLLTLNDGKITIEKL